MRMASAVLLAVAAAAGALQPLHEDFESGRTGQAWRLVLGSPGSFARFEPRNGGQCLHLFGDRASAALATREPLPNVAYTLEYDFYQPASEAEGYQAVVRHERPEGHSYWWLEYGPGRFFLYTLAGGVWFNRWDGSGLPADTWYHVRLRNTPDTVRVWIYDASGKNLLRESPPIPHDRGSPGSLAFSAVGTEKGVWGMKIDNIALGPTPVSERDDYQIRAAAVSAIRDAAQAEEVRQLWPQVNQVLSSVEEALLAVSRADPADWDAYVSLSAELDQRLRAAAEAYHAHVVARMDRKRGDWTLIDLWDYFDAEAALHGIAFPSRVPVADVKGVPFATVPFGRNCLWQDEGSRSRRAVRLGVMAKKIALLLAPKYNGALYSHDDSLVDVLQVELHYEDGKQEWVAPVPVDWHPPGPAGIGRPPYPNGSADAFVVVPGHARKISELVLCDDTTQAGWALLGLSYQPGTPDEIAPVRAGPRRTQAVVRRPAAAKRSGAEVVLENPALRLGFSTQRGELTRFESPYTGRALAGSRGSPYFAVQAGDKLLYSDAFRVVDIRTSSQPSHASVSVRLRAPSELPGLEITVSVTAGDGGETTWRAEMANLGEQPATARLIFPLLDGLDLGDRPGWYFPQRGGAASNPPVEGLSSYGGMAWLQIVDAWGPAGGLFLRCDDSTGLYKIFALRCVSPRGPDPVRVAEIPEAAHPVPPWRAATGVHLSIQYLPLKLPPGQTWAPPSATVAVHPGDWREALSAYRRWLLTWWKPLRPCPPRYRYGFFALVGGPPRDDQKGDEFGSYDWWHLADIWSIDYPDKLQEQVERWAKQAARAAAWSQAIGLYIEGMVMEKKRRIAQEHGAEWAMMDDQGNYYTYYSDAANPVWNMCPAVEAWQKWDAWAYSELARRLPLCAMYVDSLGSRWAEVCYNPAHRHDTPGIWPRGCAQLFEEIRQAVMKVSPDTAIHSEEPGCDYMALHEDGSWSHSLWTRLSGEPEFNPAGLNYFRFVLPEFKMYEIPSYRHALWRCKLAFFNGEGLWTTVPDDQRRELFIKWMPTLREHAETFLSTDVQAAVPAVAPPLYMNAFRRREKTIYTVYNAGLRSLEAEVMLPLPAGGHVFDLLELAEVQFERRNDGALLRLTLRPHEVKCFVICPRLVRFEKKDGQLFAVLQRPSPGASLIATAIDERGVRVKTVSLGSQSSPAEIGRLFSDVERPCRVLLRLAEAHDTLDLTSQPLP